MLSVEDDPAQMGVVPDAEVAATDKAFTVTLAVIQPVVLQGPSALTKYVVVVAGLTIGEEPEVA